VHSLAKGKVLGLIYFYTVLNSTLVTKKLYIRQERLHCN
jgi:hypothetical protein